MYCPALPGHDETGEGLKKVTYKEWVYAATVAVDELLKRCEKVYVIGFSMGGMIASYIASKYPVDKLVLISAAAYYINPKQIFHEVTGWFLEGIRGGLDDVELYQFYREKIKRTPLVATKEFAKMVKRLRPYLDDVKIPTFIIQGESDGLVPPKKSAQYIYEHIQSKDKKLFYFPNAKHYIWFGEEREQMLEEIEHFLCDLP